MKHVSAQVHQTIVNYQLTSKSKGFRRLTPKHEKKIVETILQTHQSKQLMELIGKRDYYNKKIYELLNSSGEEVDPLRIEDLAEAEHHIERRFMRQVEKVDQVKSLIEKHTRFYQDIELRKNALLAKYTSRQSYYGLSKLKTLNSHSERDRERAKAKELDEFYHEVMQKQKAYAVESAAMLNQLQVPFFAGRSNKQADNDKDDRGDKEKEDRVDKEKDDKEHVLQLLYKLAGPDAINI